MPPSTAKRSARRSRPAAAETDRPCRFRRRLKRLRKPTRAARRRSVWTTLVADLETPVSAFPEDRRRQADELSPGVGRGRRGARPLLDHRARSRRRVAHARRCSRNVTRPRRPVLRACREAAAGGAAQPDRRKPHRTPRGPAADGGRRVRLSRLRHGAADGRIAAAQSRSDRHSRRHPGAADHRRGV